MRLQPSVKLITEQLDGLIAAARKARDEKERWRRLCEPVPVLPSRSRELAG